MAARQPRDLYYEDQCYDRYSGRYYNCGSSAWNNWVRWVVLVVVLVGFTLLVFACSCMTARRRRKAGRQPYYGTGWLANQPGGQQTQQPYYNNQPAPPYSAPPYSPPAGHPGQNNAQYGSNQGYYGTPYGQQQNGVELQSPQPTYNRSGADEYAPPAGPPPGKGGDGIIR